jgi:acyl carrier protein
MPLTESLRTALRAHVHQLGGPPAVTDDHDLFASGTLASMQLLELITAIEDDYRIVIDERDVHTGRLRSLEAIAALIAERSRS